MLSRLSRIWLWCAAILIASLVVTPLACASAVHTSPSLALASKQTWTILIGALVPLATYCANHAAPWASEQAKAVFLVIAAAIAGGLYTALATSSFGFNSATLEMVLTAVIAALGAHSLLWRPSGISAKLGGGTNAPKQVAPVAPPA